MLNLGRKKTTLYKTSPKSHFLLIVIKAIEIVVIFELLDFSRTYLYDYVYI